MTNKQTPMDEIMLLDMVLSGLHVLRGEANNSLTCVTNEERKHAEGISYGINVAIEYVERLRCSIDGFRFRERDNNGI